MTTSDSHVWPSVTLTSRETEIARLVADGLSNRAVAAQLGLKESTVKGYLSHIYERLQISGPGSKRVGLSRWFISRNGLEG